MARSEEGMAKREGMLADDPAISKEVGDLLGIADAPAEPAPESAPAPEASPAEVAPEVAAEPAPDTTDYKAEFERLKAEASAREQEWQKQREGMVAALAGKRRERREASAQQPLTQAQQTTAQTQGIPLKWNEKGEAFIDPAQFRVSDDEIERRIEARVREKLEPIEQERLRSAIVSEDPARLTPILGEIDFSYRYLDSLVQFKQQEMGSEPFHGIDDAVNFIEFSGVGDKFRSQYPHIAPDRASLIEFLTASNRPTAEGVRAFVKKVAERKSPPPTPRAAAAFEPPPNPLDPSKPRPHADRGGKAPPNEGNSMERELNDLTEKASKQGAYSLTDTERDRLGWLTKTLTKRKAS